MNEKIIIALILIVLLVALAVAASALIIRRARNVNTSDRKQKNIEDDEYATTQRWLDLSDVSGNFLIMRDGRAICGTEILCKNRELMTTAERITDSRNLAAALSAITRSFSILCMRKPIDTTRDLQMYDEAISLAERNLSEMKYESDVVSDSRRSYENKRLERLRGWRAKSANRIGDGATKNVAYILFEAEKEMDKTAALDAARLLRGRLDVAGYPGSLLYGPDLLDVCMSYLGATVLAHPNITSESPVVPTMFDNENKNPLIYEIYGNDEERVNYDR